MEKIVSFDDRENDPMQTKKLMVKEEQRISAAMSLIKLALFGRLFIIFNIVSGFH